jgi:hypothetical protein
MRAVRNFRLQHPSGEDCAWLRDTLDRDYRRFGVYIALGGDDWKLDWERTEQSPIAHSGS